MTVRPILAIGHPTLRTVAETVPIETIAGEDVQQLVNDLVETMRAANGADPATLSTWDEFEAHHRDAFIERISTLVDEVGS